MKKLHLESLRVDSFATTAPAPRGRGTVAAREATGTSACCPDSTAPTCWVTCLTCDTIDAC
jgi:hypothetical protein